LEELQLVRIDDDRPDRVESFYQELVATIATNPAQSLVLDLSSVQFISPDALMRLITVARLWHRMTGNPVILDGMRLDVHQYLERMDLFTACGECIRPAQHLATADRWSRSRASDKLLEVMPVSAVTDQNSRDVTTAVARAQRILGTWFGTDSTTIGPVATMLSEVASNVTHSRDRGFMVIQHHRRGRPGHRH
jgi:anti-anti-sigma regulatory factor